MLAEKRFPSNLPGVTPGISGLYSGLNSKDFFEGPVRPETRLVDVAAAFTEGPAADRQGNVYFSNIPTSQIFRWNPGSRQLSLFRNNSHRTNGLLFDRQGKLLACEGETGRITRTDMRTGEIEILADSYAGHPLEAPNDMALDCSGRLYFSSRPSADAPARGYINAVYRLDPDGTLHQVLKEPEVQMPNGIVISPDNQTLFLIEAHPDERHNRQLMAYDLEPGGAVANPRVLIDFYPGRSGDGMCIDGRGNLYVAAGLHKRRNTSETLDTKPGIHVISPRGRLLAYAETPEDTVTNCTFGGGDLRTIYITAGAQLLSLRTRIAGLPPY